MDDYGTEFPSSALPSGIDTCFLVTDCSQRMELWRPELTTYLLDQVLNESSQIEGLLPSRLLINSLILEVQYTLFRRSLDF
jgi:hypothetical protein